MRFRVSLCFLIVGAIVGLPAEGMVDRECQKHIDDFSKRYRMHRTKGGILVDLIKKNLEDTLDDITFTLYTQKNPKKGQTLRINGNDELKNSNFDAGKPTRFVTHGWQNDGHSRSCTLIRNAYLSHDDCNVIIVDWSKHTKSRCYLFAVYMVKHRIGKKVAAMIDFLYEKGNLDTKSTTLIGHSLGAHVMGIAGFKARRIVNYVIGLDPALPGFLFAGSHKSISRASGKYVQIIHTNGGVSGRLSAIGHVDFFPNGGTDQPGCGTNRCSHNRAYQLFASSIKRPIKGTLCASYEKFNKKKCGSHAKMASMSGLNLEHVLRGNYYLRTSSKAPYSRPESCNFLYLCLCRSFFYCK